VCAACGYGNASANSCAYDDAAGVLHGDARAYIYCHTDANRDQRFAHSDAAGDLYA